MQLAKPCGRRYPKCVAWKLDSKECRKFTCPLCLIWQEKEKKRRLQKMFGEKLGDVLGKKYDDKIRIQQEIFFGEQKQILQQMQMRKAEILHFQEMQNLCSAIIMLFCERGRVFQPLSIKQFGGGILTSFPASYLERFINNQNIEKLYILKKMKQQNINIFFGFLKAIMFLSGIFAFLFFFVALALLFINLAGAFFCIVFCIAFLWLFHEANKVRRQIVLLKRIQKQKR